jgi:hypothetical protein
LTCRGRLRGCPGRRGGTHAEFTNQRLSAFTGCRFDDNLGGTGGEHIEPFSSRTRHIKNTGTDKRPAIVHPDGDFFAVRSIGYDEIRAKRQINMRRRKLCVVKNLAGSGRTARKFGPIPRGDTFLPENV